MPETTIIKTFWDFLYTNGSVPFICVTAAIAFASWRSQQRLARAKNSIDLQNNFLASQRIHADMVAVAGFANTKDAAWRKELATVTAGQVSKEQKIALDSLRSVLNAFERVAIGVNNKVYDERLLFESYASFVIDTHLVYSDYLEIKRDGHKSYYVSFCLMAKKWEKLRAAGRKPGDGMCFDLED